VRRPRRPCLPKLDEAQAELGVGQHGVWTVEEAVTAWLKDGLPGRTARTKTKHRQVLAPILNDMGYIPLRDLTAREVQASLAVYARSHADSTVGIARLSLECAVNYALAHGKAIRKVLGPLHALRLLGDEAPPLRQRVDQALFSELGHRPAHGLPRDLVLLLQIGLAGDRVMWRQSPARDVCPQFGRELLI